ncbi:DUF3427 domain-containing protein [Paraliobacillus sp. X-1268]|uniref:DUF3427 domain-containing protein n=1 Tax=Paraliobacillus sp. X-1268 TaxID=2213193 RepID=UPI000E3EB77A|nr:DEAD/DEAH box helicase [Paraliobacillus sp. X-1268]
MEDFIKNLENSLHKGFINQNHSTSGSYMPKLLINDPKSNINVLDSLLEELENSSSFIFSVAFITESGLATLKSHLLDIKNKGVQGRILTSTFLKFNNPKVFKELLKIKNVEVRLTDIAGFHSKGYIFKNQNHYSLIVGSSNLTAQALKVNYEWNIKLTSHDNGDIVHHFKNQFEEVWSNAQALTEQWIESYEEVYVNEIVTREDDKLIELPTSYSTNTIKDALQIVPNKMQQAALKQIQSLRVKGENKGLIISATGTGKTYLSAFDVRSFRPKRMLFIVHREQILNKAKSDFQRILGGIDKDFGIISGSTKQTEAKYIFATIQTISKKEYMEQFKKDTFDYILIDEVHKAGAQSYLNVIKYFKPKFLMGMTATPERTDDFNIYELFDYNIAYEIRLQEALEEDMLCSFHYFGVTDLDYNGEIIDDATILSKLVTSERVNHMLEKINYYGFSGDKVKGLIFCSRKDEARTLSIALNNRGLRTVSLVGDHSQEERALRVNQLESGKLDYILTVDIFNEGIDIPSVNQVVMIRQTKSSIIFIQQLGRGLRKHDSKDFVTIIDFIGNYNNNYLIPVALSGDKSQNKDNIRRKTTNTSYIKGVSTINFEEIAKKRIFNAINNSNLTTLKLFKDAFSELRNKIGRVPYLYDFILNQSIDPIVITEKYFNYHQFLLKVLKEAPSLTEYENNVLSMLSLEVLDGKRSHEIILLDLLLRKGKVEYKEYINHLKDMGCAVDNSTIASVNSIFNLSFFTKNCTKKYGDIPIIYLNTENNYLFNEQIMKNLQNNKYFNKLVVDIVNSAKEKNKSYQRNKQLTLYEKYSRKDACKLLNWEKDESSTMYGYKPKHNTCPIFITYHKNDNIDSSVNYGDEFLNHEVLKWFSRSNRTLKSEEVQKIIHASSMDNTIHLFVKKDDDEGTDFYYLGTARPDKQSVSQTTMADKNGKELPVVCMNMIMEQPLHNQLYNYIKKGLND